MSAEEEQRLLKVCISMAKLELWRRSSMFSGRATGAPPGMTVICWCRHAGLLPGSAGSGQGQ